MVFLLFVLGFYSPLYNRHIRALVLKLINKLPPVNDYTIEIKNLPMLLIFLFVLGWISRILLVKMGMYYHTEVGYNPIVQPTGFKQVATYVNIGSTFPLIGLSLCFVEWLKNQKKIYFLLLSILLLIPEIIYALPTGSKERILFPVAILIFLYSLKTKLAIVPILFSMLIFVLFVFPFVGIYRSIFLTGDAVLDLSRTFDIYWHQFRYFDKENVSKMFYMIFGERLNYSLVVSIIIENTPKIWDFKHGFTYLFFIISFIPRIIWPGKPSITSFDNVFGRDYGFLGRSDYTTSIDMTWVGEMFINFGWYGILVAFLYGIIFQTLYTYFLRQKRLSQLSAILYSFGLYYMVRGGEFAAQFSGLFKIYLVIFILMYPFLKRAEVK
ncbi:MAG: hypothetical protein HY094_08860 [Candidatus Melainabacteria bacterium]|nr:hypothetical protein [Candidatus Melainabacteria bacterium]